MAEEVTVWLCRYRNKRYESNNLRGRGLYLLSKDPEEGYSVFDYWEGYLTGNSRRGWRCGSLDSSEWTKLERRSQ